MCHAAPSSLVLSKPPPSAKPAAATIPHEVKVPQDIWCEQAYECWQWWKLTEQEVNAVNTVACSRLVVGGADQLWPGRLR